MSVGAVCARYPLSLGFQTDRRLRLSATSGSRPAFGRIGSASLYRHLSAHLDDAPRWYLKVVSRIVRSARKRDVEPVLPSWHVCARRGSQGAPRYEK